MRFILHFLVSYIFASAVALSQTAEAHGGWRSLPLVTNGKLDPNWIHIGYGGWTVEQGALKTKPDAKGLGLLVYQKERFGNCQIRLIFKTQEVDSNSGLYVRIADGILDQINKPGATYERDSKGEPSAESTERMKASADREEGPWFAVHRGYEIQICSASDCTPLNGTGAVYSLAKSTAIQTDTRKWVTMVVTLQGERILVDVNGRRVSEFDANHGPFPERETWYQPKREFKRPQAGFIGLQTHDPNDIVWFKEISVRPLQKSSPK